jgi:NADH-quinone oxidoreductase subunit A
VEFVLTLSVIPFLVYLAGVLLVLGVMYGVSYLTGERHRGRETDEIYESGIKTTGDARSRYSARFYLVAMLFVIFDLEVIFLFAWAVGAREVGWPGYLGLIAFLVILLAGLAYEWRMGALDWAQKRIREYYRLRGYKNE